MRAARWGWASAPTRASRRSSAFTLLTSSKELRNLGQAPRRLHRRQALQDLPAVGLGNQPRVAQHQHAAVGLVADQAPGALLELQYRLRQLQLRECITFASADR